MEDQIFEQRTDLTALNKAVMDIRNQIKKVIIGQDEMVKLILTAMLADGHVLIEGVPGIAKTLTAKLIARSLHAGFSRVQFTPDLMPSDVLGTPVFDPAINGFDFKKGPVFSNIILIDEINRAPAKTQSALFEIMEERQATIDGKTYLMEQPFMVLATQNPIEQEGTYRLPEAQLDRFMLRLHMGYPSMEDERAILHDRERTDPLDQIEPVLTADEVKTLQAMVTRVRVDEVLVDYLLKIVDATRRSEAFELGISPRGSLALFRSAQSMALIEGRDYCIADDIKRLVLPCFAHRVIVSARASAVRNRTREAEQALVEILQTVAVPV